MSVSPSGGPLRVAALIAALAGAGVSLGFLLNTGRRTPRLLLLLFVLWVLSPFVALVWANMVSKRWPVGTRTALYTLTWILTLSSMAIYGAIAADLVKTRPAPVFLLVPLGSWLLLATVIPLAAVVSRRHARR